MRALWDPGARAHDRVQALKLAEKATADTNIDDLQKAEDSLNESVAGAGEEARWRFKIPVKRAREAIVRLAEVKEAKLRCLTAGVYSGSAGSDAEAGSAAGGASPD